MSQSGARVGQDIKALAAQQQEIAAQKRQAAYGLRFECHQRAVNATTMLEKTGSGADLLSPATPEQQMAYADELYAWITQDDG